MKKKQQKNPTYFYKLAIVVLNVFKVFKLNT